MTVYPLIPSRTLRLFVLEGLVGDALVSCVSPPFDPVVTNSWVSMP